tara:strand:+ start:181 stop:759 length:579 start_codon:yes stop_codon:yes gene_type:complete
MAIDSRGQVTTTGILNKPNTNVQAPNMSNLTQPQVKQSAQAPQVKQSAQVPQPIAREIPQRSVEDPSKDNTVERLQTLTDEDMIILNPVLSPSVKSVLVKIMPEITPLFERIGINEEIIPIKISAFTSLPEDIQSYIMNIEIESSTQQMDTNNVPLDTPSDTSGMMARQEPEIPQTSGGDMNYNQIDEGLIS